MLSVSKATCGDKAKAEQIVGGKVVGGKVVGGKVDSDKVEIGYC